MASVSSHVTPNFSWNIPTLTHLLVEIVGYVTRALSYNRTGSLPLYIMQATFLLLPPIFFAASMYMTYSRIVRTVRGQSFSLITPRWTTRLFVFGDLFTLNIQGNGAGLLANPDTIHIGNPIVVTGLILQVLLFIVFVVVSMKFHGRFRTHLKETGASCEVPWTTYLHVLYSMSLAILVRNIYRIVEYIMGQNGYLMENEWPTWAFDSAPMFIVMVVFLIWYPGVLQPPPEEESIELDSEMGSREQGQEEKPDAWSWHPLVYLYRKLRSSS